MIMMTESSLPDVWAECLDFKVYIPIQGFKLMKSAKQKPSFQFLQQRREEILMLAVRHGAKNVRVFGSVARGEADEDSDIDFLIDYDLDKISPWFPAGLLLDLEGLLGFKVDVATVDMLKVRIKEQVLQEAITL